MRSARCEGLGFRETVGALLAAGIDRLSANSTTPRLDAEVLLAHILQWSRARLLATHDYIPDMSARQQFQELLARRARGEPVAYLVGYREFYGFDVQVDRRVLVPRPETELVVECAIAALHHSPSPVPVEGNNPHAPLLIADVGTGSGAIAIALALHIPGVHIFATDTSTDALDVAAANVACSGLEHCITLLHCDLVDALPSPVHMIVSNPPYEILAQVDDNVRLHEPHLALDGGPDGLVVYRRLLMQAPAYLHAGGHVVLEIGATQAQAVVALAKQAMPHAHATVHRDLAGHERVVVIRM